MHPHCGSSWQLQLISLSACQPVAGVQQCEDLEDTESLHSLYRIMKGAVLLNDISLLELLFSDRYVMDVVCLTAMHTSSQNTTLKDAASSTAATPVGMLGMPGTARRWQWMPRHSLSDDSWGRLPGCR